ncbi:MAG: heme transporter ATP-binding protein [Tardiphaga sp.]|nr:heme transporter ATP-binding protein [Tardiphaga sp.]
MSTIARTAKIGLTIRDATLVDGIDLSVRSGEAVAIVGPNGAGKSTLLRLMSGDLRPTGGRMSLKERDLASYAPRDLAMHRAVLSQHVNVSFPFTVEEIVTMGAVDAGLATARPIVAAMLGELDLLPFRDREMTTLSGGEQQRAHFARVLVQLHVGEAAHGPALLLLDEPTSSLDMRHQIDLVEIAKRRARAGTAVVAVLHDLNLATRFADRIVMLHHGRVVADGRPADVVTRAMLRQVFEIDAELGHADDGAPFLLPQRITAVP